MKRIRITADEHAALIRAAPPVFNSVRIQSEPVTTSFGSGGVYLLPTDGGRWQGWALALLWEMRGYPA